MLKNSNTAYGAIIEGEHYFFNSHDGKPEKREGLAKFMNLWILKDGIWKMARVLSYDHHEAPYINARKEIRLSKRDLNKFTGEYTGPQSGAIKAIVKNNYLTLIIGKNKYTLYPETNSIFFVKERDLTFEFVSQKGKPANLVIRENGKIVEEAKNTH